MLCKRLCALCVCACVVCLSRFSVTPTHTQAEDISRANAKTELDTYMFFYHRYEVCVGACVHVLRARCARECVVW
jgi:hypothetical protein